MKTAIFTLTTLSWLLASPNVAAHAQAEELKCGPVKILEGPIADEACDKIRTLSEELKRKPQKKIYLARQRAGADAEQLRTLLTAEGYYAATAAYDLEGEKEFTPIFQVSPGKRFSISSYEIMYEEAERELPGSAKDLGISGRKNPNGKAIVAVENAILTHYQNGGFPQAKLVGRKIHANFETASAKIQLTYNLGAACTYGEVNIEGLERIEPEFASALVTLKTAKPCSLKEMEEERIKLGRTGLFASTDIQPAEKSKTSDRHSIAVKVKEAKARTVGAGLSYASNSGAGGHIFWEHRNLLGAAENLRAEIKIEDIKQEGTLSFRKPIPAREATVFTSIGARTEALDAYDAQRYTFKIGTDFPLAGPWKLSESIEYEYADVEEGIIHQTGHSLLVPFTLSQSTVADRLDTRDGVILDLTVAPAYSTFGDGSAFLKFDGRIAYHKPLSGSEKFDGAVWAHIGTLQGAASSNISPTQLYYGGGSNSVRAIAWEHLGSLDSEGTPQGGRSILEGGLELRYKIRKNWQVAAFVEGGRAFSASTPNFEEDILWGGGLGLRYHTSIGPLRLDIAAPFNPRQSDDDVQFYIGLGQAF